LRFAEEVSPGFFYTYEGDLVTSEHSRFQRIEIWGNETFGRILVLDGLVQTTERDEFIYHEMLAHVPMLSVEAPRSVLVIGGGDGGTLRHVLMHPSVERAVMVEIDERVTQLCREWMSSIAGEALEDPRADVRFTDGIAFVRDSDETFDVILVDSSDPVGPGEGLFTPEFYGTAAARLRPGGVLAAQSGSPMFQQDEMHRAHRHARTAFPDVRAYTCTIPTYPGACWSFVMAGESLDLDADAAAERASARGLVTRYWTPALQRGAFDLSAVAEAVVSPHGPPHTWGRSPEENRRVVPRI